VKFLHIAVERARIVLRIAMAVAAVSLVLTPQRIAAESLLQPLGKWDLDYAVAQCAAIRNYGTTQHPVTLMIRPSPVGDTYEILVARKDASPEFAEELEGTVDFGAGPIKAWLLHFRSQKQHLDVYQFRISAAEMVQGRSASSVILRIRNAPDFAFSLASMPQLLSGLDACTADLKTYWNMGGEKDGRIATPASGGVRRLFSPDDYPTEAMSRHQEGRAQFLLLVDEKGKVAGCHVILASGVPVLDAMGCAILLDRAQFTPALDPSGRPVRSTLTTPPVQWRIR
jgi:Gram-negative bacterial TonB protein C-terminal